MSTFSVDELILEPTEYAGLRSARRADAMALRRDRRVPLGDVVVVEFENTATLRYQAQEMLYVERVTSPTLAAAEIAVYERLLPTPQRLTATMMVEIADQNLVRAELDRLDGIHEALVLHVGDHALPAREIPPPDEGPSAHTYTVHFFGFDLSPDDVEALNRGARCRLVIDHPAYHADTELSAELVALLAGDIRAAAG